MSDWGAVLAQAQYVWSNFVIILLLAFECYFHVFYMYVCVCICVCLSVCVAVVIYAFNVNVCFYRVIKR